MAVGLGIGMKEFPRLLVAVVGILLLSCSCSFSQTGKWVLCLGDPSEAHFFHDSQASECHARIAVKAIAFLTGGVNFGTRVAVSDAGKLVEERRDIYLPRGISVLILDETLNGKRVAYAWGTYTFFSMPSYSITADSKKSYAWQNFDVAVGGRHAITLQKTTIEKVRVAASMAGPGDQSSSGLLLPQEIPSGRIVELQDDVALIDGVEKQEVSWGQFAGYVDPQALRGISYPNLNVKSKYYVGSQLAQSQIFRECGDPALTSPRRYAGGSGPTTNVSAKSYVYRIFELRRPWPLSVFGSNHKLFERDYSFEKMARCDAKETRIVVSEGSRTVSISDGPALVRNEEDYEKFASVLRRANFSNDEVFFIIARTMSAKK